MLMFPSQEHLVLAIKIRWQINSVWMTYHRRKLSSELDANAGDRLLNCGKQPSGLMCYSVQNLRESSLIAGSPLLLSLRQNPLPIARGGAHLHSCILRRAAHSSRNFSSTNDFTSFLPTSKVLSVYFPMYEQVSANHASPWEPHVLINFYSISGYLFKW